MKLLPSCGVCSLALFVSARSAVGATSVSACTVRLPESLTIPVALGGTLGAPAVRFRADEMAKALVRGKAEEAARAARQEVEKKTEATRNEAEAKAGAAIEDARKKGAEAAQDLFRKLGGKQ